MRLFVAIELPEPVHGALAKVQETLRDSLGSGGVSWTKPENLHLTLKFIGEWPDERVSELSEKLQGVSAPTIELELGKPGTLPPRGAARVLTVDLAGDIEGLSELARQLEEQCHAAGVPRESRRYRPHVTLGRPRPPRLVSSELLARAAPARDYRWTVDRFVLMQSRLSPKGSTYTPVATFSLAMEP